MTTSSIQTPSLAQILREIHWPQDACCCSQDPDGYLIFWNNSINFIAAAKTVANGESIKKIVGIESIVCSHYLGTLAHDWETAVISKSNVLLSLLVELTTNDCAWLTGIHLVQNLATNYLGAQLSINKNRVLIKFDDFECICCRDTSNTELLSFIC